MIRRPASSNTETSGTESDLEMANLKGLFIVGSGPALLFLLACIAILAGSFTSNKNCLLVGLDGTAWRVVLKAQAQDHAPFSQTGVDPYEGSFDGYYPVFREYLLPGAFALLAGGTMPGKVAVYTIYAALLLLAAFLFARSAGFDQPTALIGGFLLPLMSLPEFVGKTGLFYPLFSLNPHISEITGLSLLIVASFWALDAEAGRLRLLLIPVPLLCLIIAVPLMIPATALYGGASFCTARRWRDNLPRVTAILLMIVVPLALGTLTYVHGLVGYTAYQFFSDDFEQTRNSLFYASTFFWMEPYGRIAILLGFASAVWAIVSAAGRLRIFAVAHIVITLGYFIVALAVVRFVTTYQGPSPVYFETCFWAYSLLFCAFALTEAARGAVHWLRSSRTAPVRRLVGRGGIVAMTLTLGLVVGVNAWAALRSQDQCAQFGFTPIRPTPITDALQRSVALHPGTPFRGIVATIDGVDDRASVDWFDLDAFDAQVWRDTGDDHRLVGLWQFGIPTLFQYFTLITPPYYLLLTDFLARPADRQTRSVLVLTQINPAIMQLWGVRYLITDKDPGTGTEVASAPIQGHTRLRLIALPRPNLGDYSPTEVEEVDTFRSGLRAMHERGFDGSRRVITDSHLSSPFVPASNAALTYEKDGFHLTADSAGRSILVLPVQYSHCWTASGTGEPQLFRANLMQLAVAFKGHLDTRLVFRFGPILAGECRVTDLEDMGRLKIKEARSPLLHQHSRP
jgi:hypothetical protein